MATEPLYVVEANDTLACLLAPTVRQADADEVLAFSRQTPLEALRGSLKTSTEAHAIMAEGHADPLMLFGYQDIARGWCVAWAISGSLVETYPREFISVSRAEVGKALERWPVMTNWVDVRYERSIRWLTKMGAQFLPPLPQGAAGLPFTQFILCREWFCG